MNRRVFLGAFFPLAVLGNVEEQRPHIIPMRWILRYKLRPVREGIPADRIVCRGEDGHLYRLDDLLRVLFMHHKA